MRRRLLLSRCHTSRVYVPVAPRRKLHLGRHVQLQQLRRIDLQTKPARLLRLGDSLPIAAGDRRKTRRIGGNGDRTGEGAPNGLEAAQFPDVSPRRTLRTLRRRESRKGFGSRSGEPSPASVFSVPSVVKDCRASSAKMGDERWAMPRIQGEFKPFGALVALPAPFSPLLLFISYRRLRRRISMKITSATTTTAASSSGVPRAAARLSAPTPMALTSSRTRETTRRISSGASNTRPMT